MYENYKYGLPLNLAIGDRLYWFSTGAYTTSYSAVEFNGFPAVEGLLHLESYREAGATRRRPSIHIQIQPAVPGAERHIRLPFQKAVAVSGRVRTLELGGQHAGGEVYPAVAGAVVFHADGEPGQTVDDQTAKPALPAPLTGFLLGQPGDQYARVAARASGVSLSSSAWYSR